VASKDGSFVNLGGIRFAYSKVILISAIPLILQELGKYFVPIPPEGVTWPKVMLFWFLSIKNSQCHCYLLS